MAPSKRFVSLISSRSCASTAAWESARLGGSGFGLASILALKPPAGLSLVDFDLPEGFMIWSWEEVPNMMLLCRL